MIFNIFSTGASVVDNNDIVFEIDYSALSGPPAGFDIKQLTADDQKTIDRISDSDLQSFINTINSRPTIATLTVDGDVSAFCPLCRLSLRAHLTGLPATGPGNAQEVAFAVVPSNPGFPQNDQVTNFQIVGVPGAQSMIGTYQPMAHDENWPNDAITPKRTDYPDPGTTCVAVEFINGEPIPDLDLGENLHLRAIPTFYASTQAYFTGELASTSGVRSAEASWIASLHLASGETIISREYGNDVSLKIRYSDGTEKVLPNNQCESVTEQDILGTQTSNLLASFTYQISVRNLQGRTIAHSNFFTT